MERPGLEATDNENIPAINSGIKIWSYHNQFKIECPYGVYPTYYTVFSVIGQIVKQGRLNGQQTETISIAELQGGIYMVKVDATEDCKTVSVTQKITKTK